MSEDSISFLSQFAKAKVRHEPAQMELASSLLELCGGFGADSPTPSSSEVVADDRFSGW